MKVKANQTFKDLESKIHRLAGSTFDVTEARRKELGAIVSEVKEDKVKSADKTDKEASASKTK